MGLQGVRPEVWGEEEGNVSVRIYARLGRNVGMSMPLRDVLYGWAVIFGVIFFAVRSCLETPEDEVAARRAAAHPACTIDSTIRKLFSKVELKTAHCATAAGYDHWGPHGPVYVTKRQP